MHTYLGGTGGVSLISLFELGLADWRRHYRTQEARTDVDDIELNWWMKMGWASTDSECRGLEEMSFLHFTL
jgi:hypothetical protein